MDGTPPARHVSKENTLLSSGSRKLSFCSHSEKQVGPVMKPGGVTKFFIYPEAEAMKNLLGRRKSGLLMLTQPFLISKLINKTLRVRVVAHLHVLLLCFSKSICICYLVWSLSDCEADRTIVGDEKTSPERLKC